MELKKRQDVLPAIGMIAALIFSMTNVVGADKTEVKMEVKTAFHVPLGQRQLFLDEYGIAKMENLKRTMHQAAKKGAVIRPNEARNQHSYQIRSAPMWDPDAKLFKFIPTGGPADLHAVSDYYESADGLHWAPRVTRQVKYRGSLENNFVTVKKKSGGGYANIWCVVRDPFDPDPSRRYKGFIPHRGVSPVVSPDLIRWKMLDAPPVPSGDEFNLSFDETDRQFLLTVKRGGPHGRSVALATSKDFEHWKDYGLIFHADELDQKLGLENIKNRYADPNLRHPPWNDPKSYNVDVYNMGVFRYEGVYIGMPAMFHSTGPVPNYPNTVGFHLVQLVSSRDLKNWKRLGDRKPFIGPSRLGSGAYDLTQILGPSYPVVQGDELWFYYTGLKYRGSFTYVGKYPHGKHVQVPGLDTDTGAICLAVLRRDGFISLDAGQEEGVLLTKPFVLRGNKLYVNVNAAKGKLCVEVLDKDGKTVAVSSSLRGDFLRAKLSWRRGNLAKLEGKVVSLRFKLRNAGFYSYWTDN